MDIRKQRYAMTAFKKAIQSKIADDLNNVSGEIPGFGLIVSAPGMGSSTLFQEAAAAAAEQQGSVLAQAKHRVGNLPSNSVAFTELSAAELMLDMPGNEQVASTLRNLASSPGSVLLVDLKGATTSEHMAALKLITDKEWGGVSLATTSLFVSQDPSSAKEIPSTILNKATVVIFKQQPTAVPLSAALASRREIYTSGATDTRIPKRGVPSIK